jgi:hypothetical protein
MIQRNKDPDPTSSSHAMKNLKFLEAVPVNGQAAAAGKKAIEFKVIS